MLIIMYVVYRRRTRTGTLARWPTTTGTRPHQLSSQWRKSSRRPTGTLSSLILCCSVVDPDPYSNPDSWGPSVSVSKRAKMAQKNRKQFWIKFHLLKCWMFSFEGWRLPFFHFLNLEEKRIQLYFFPFLVIKTLDPYRYPDTDSLEMLDPQHCFADPFNTSFRTSVVDPHWFQLVSINAKFC